MVFLDKNSVDAWSFSPIEFNVGQYYREGMELFRKDIGKFVLGFFVYLVFSSAVGMVPFGSLVAMPVFAGLFTICYKIDNGKLAEIGDMFSFEKLLDFLLFSLLSILISVAFCIPFLVSFMPSIFMYSNTNMTDIGFFEVFGPISLLLLGLAVFFILVFHVLLFYVIPLIHFGNYKCIEAMKTSVNIAKNHFWSIILFYFLCFFILMLGVAICFVGVFISAPLVICMHYAAYKHILQIK